MQANNNNNNHYNFIYYVYFMYMYMYKISTQLSMQYSCINSKVPLQLKTDCK